MKNKVSIIAFACALSGCASSMNPITNQDHAEESKVEKVKHKSWQEQQREIDEQNEKEFLKKANDTGCYSYALNHSKVLFSLALKYYGTNPSAVTENPQMWAESATRACVSGYDAGETNQSPALLDQYMYSMGSITNDPFHYRAISDSLYWGYKRAMR